MNSYGKTRWFRRLAWMSVLLLSIGSGCVSNIYDDQRSTSAASSVPPKSNWQISGDLVGLRQAIDGNVATGASSASYYTNAQITIDMGKPSVFNMVIVDQGNSEMGFPRRLAVSASMDGKNFIYLYAVPGTRRVTMLNWVTPVLARYIRLQAVAQGDMPWSVAEIYVR